MISRFGWLTGSSESGFSPCNLNTTLRFNAGFMHQVKGPTDSESRPGPAGPGPGAGGPLPMSLSLRSRRHSHRRLGGDGNRTVTATVTVTATWTLGPAERSQYLSRGHGHVTRMTVAFPADSRDSASDGRRPGGNLKS